MSSPFVVIVAGKVHTRHETAMAAEVEAAKLRSCGWHAYALDQVAAREAKRARRTRP